MGYYIKVPPWHAKRQEELERKIEAGTIEKGEMFEYQELAVSDNRSFEMMVMAFVVLKLSKTPEGLKTIQVLGKEFIKGIFDTLHALGQASAANQTAAWANPYLVLMVLDRFGFVTGRSVGEFKLGLSVISGASIAEGFLDTVQGFFPFTSPEAGEFPTSIVYSARTEGDTVKEEITAKGTTPKDIKQLRKLLGEKEP